MSARVAVLTFAIALASCRTYQASWTSTRIGVGLTLGGVGVLGAGVVVDSPNEVTNIAIVATGFPLFTTGLALLVGGIVGRIVFDENPRPDIEPSAPPPQQRLDLELTDQAKQAARDGDCAGVKELAPKVNALSPATYAKRFLIDPGIARCMAPAPNAVQSPEPVQSPPDR